MSPLPFGVLPPGYIVAGTKDCLLSACGALPTLALRHHTAALPSPLPFGVLPPGYSGQAIGIQMSNAESPLPFGVLPPGYWEDRTALWLAHLASPLPFGVLPPGYKIKIKI